MGFFKDLNDDAVEVSEDIISEEAEAEEVVSEAAQEAEDSVDASLLENLFDESAPADEEVMVEEDYVIDEPAAQPAAAPAAKSAATDDQVTVITAGTTINGSIVSDCSLNVMGTINGDIECIGKLTISGSVSGNSIASDVYVNAKRLDGNIDSEGTVKIGLGTVVVGDIKAGSAVIAGAVKGELDIKGPVIFDSTAIIKGNVKAKSVQMNNGAVLEGFCSLTYAAVDIDDIFE
ncbi:MAG: polymer-forming cytoskeletal protein [Lachnospiraceae bacterium]|nr:polymer-forming cytoskeletal protein [Lachnospiraceae bacterium]MBP5653770.1 polymer-forming cytoskeletal protein [Lachnospiraceae bacterium]